jgi:putative FmdB family regulatory protein
MSLMSFEFMCSECKHIFDDLVQSSEKTLPCPVCKSTANRILSPPRFDIRMGVDAVGNPTMGAKWARQHEQARKVEEKRARDNGPGVWGSNGADVRR